MKTMDDTKSLKPGSRVRLWWNGYAGVPRSASGSWATVVRVLRKRVEVQIDGWTGTDKVRLDQIER